MLIDELLGEIKLRGGIKLPENLQDVLQGEIEKVPDV